jgi:hypothetical protein
MCIYKKNLKYNRVKKYYICYRLGPSLLTSSLKAVMSLVMSTLQEAPALLNPVVDEMKRSEHSLTKTSKKRKATRLSRADFKLLSESILEIRQIVRSTSDLVNKFREAVSKPLNPVKKSRLSSM